MKRKIHLILLCVGVAGFLASCQCKTCKKDGDPSQQVCKENGSQSDYDNYINFLQSAGYTCQ